MASSTLRHIARSLFCTDSEIAMFSSYFDASGNDRHRVVTVAGFVSRLHKWDRFDRDWKLILKANPKVNMFRMSNFVSAKEGWEDWHGKENSAKRAKLVSDLVSCIREHTNKGFANSITLADYERANAIFRLKEELGGAYALCGMACLSSLKKWAEKKRIDYTRVLAIFEDGDEYQGKLLQAARSERFNAIPESKRDIRMFDACDLAAWKAKSIIDVEYNRKAIGDPEAYERIVQALKQLELVVQTDSLTHIPYLRLVNICETLPVPVPRRNVA